MGGAGYESGPILMKEDLIDEVSLVPRRPRPTRGRHRSHDTTGDLLAKMEKAKEGAAWIRPAKFRRSG
jgi:hypothetical protein